MPLALSFHVAAAIECDPGVKQRLLVERSTARRVEALLLLVPDPHGRRRVRVCGSTAAPTPTAGAARAPT